MPTALFNLVQAALALMLVAVAAPAQSQPMPDDLEAVFTGDGIVRYPIYYARTPAGSDAAALPARTIIADKNEAAQKYGGFPFTSAVLSDDGIEGTPSYWLANLPTEVDGVEIVLKFRAVAIEQKGNRYPLQFMLGNSPDGYLWFAIDKAGQLLIAKRTREGWDDYVNAGEFPVAIDLESDNELHVIWLDSGRFFVKVDGEAVYSGDARGAIPADVPLIGRSNRLVVRGALAFEEILLNQLVLDDEDGTDPPGLTFAEVLQLADAAFAGSDPAGAQAFYIEQQRDLRERNTLVMSATASAPGLTGGILITLKVGPDGRVYQLAGADTGKMSGVQPSFATLRSRLPDGWTHDAAREWLVPPR